MTELLPCPFCGTEPALISEGDYHSVACPHYYCNFSQIALRSEKKAIERWNTRAQPQSLTGCLHPGKEPLSCQYEGQCLSASCNHNGKTWYGARMTLEAQDPNLLYPKVET